MKIFLIAALAVFTSITALSQTEPRSTTYAQTKQELISLGQKAVVNGGGTAKIVVDDRFTGRTEAVLENKTGELVNPKVTITDNRAVVTGHVAFKGGLQPTDQPTPVTIRFMKQDGQWRFAGMCIGSCE